jgi:hypothetical protein
MNRQEIAEAYAKTELQDNHAPIAVIVAAAFIDGIDYEQHHPRWISVEDELPPITYTSSTWLSTDEVLVLTAISGGTPRIGRFEIDRLNGGAYWLIDGKQYADFIELDEEMMRLVGTAEKHQRAVTHWMPLPQAPMKGGEQ